MVLCRKIKHSPWTTCIGGFKEACIKDIDDFLSELEDLIGACPFQVFNANRVAGWKHLYHASINAVYAHQTSEMISNSIDIETLLYASCQDQIFRAFRKLGINPGLERVALIIFAGNRGEALEAYSRAELRIGRADDSVMNITDEKFSELKQVYDVTEEELSVMSGGKKEALRNIIIEKGALLITLR